MADIFETEVARHTSPTRIGEGRYLPPESISSPEVVMGLLRAARSNDLESYKAACAKVDGFKDATLRGWLDLVPPRVWSAENPMKVAIVGFGAAGALAIEALEALKLPFEYDVFEGNVGSKVGLVGAEVSPKKAGIKRSVYHRAIDYWIAKTLSYGGGSA